MPQAVPQRSRWLYLLLGSVFLLLAQSGLADPAASLPPEAIHTLQLIKAGGPFPYERDGVVFGNFEKRLPTRPRGYYHEYTVPTPGEHTRGARRIISGGQPPSEFFYTADHYRRFQRIEGP